MQTSKRFYQRCKNEERELELSRDHDQAMKYERRLLEEKIEAAVKTTHIAENTVRLPKLNITRFSGKPHDWVRFSGQFEAMVNSPLI